MGGGWSKGKDTGKGYGGGGGCERVEGGWRVERVESVEGVESGGWRVEGEGWRVEGEWWRVPFPRK